MLVFVDYEHASGHSGDNGQRILAARTRITYRLEDVSGQPCHLVRYDRFDASLLDRLEATAIFISGNSTAPAMYDAAALEPLYEAVRSSGLPVFGFCGGHQVIAGAFGAPVVPLDPAVVSDDNPMIVRSREGVAYEFGYHPVDISDAAADHPLFDGLTGESAYRHAHGLHVPEAPEGFTTIASTVATPVQVMVDEDRKIVGTQFHPEYWTDEHLGGRRMIENFLDWAR